MQSTSTGNNPPLIVVEESHRKFSSERVPIYEISHPFSGIPPILPNQNPLLLTRSSFDSAINTSKGLTLENAFNFQTAPTSPISREFSLASPQGGNDFPQTKLQSELEKTCEFPTLLQPTTSKIRRKLTPYQARFEQACKTVAGSLKRRQRSASDRPLAKLHATYSTVDTADVTIRGYRDIGKLLI